MIKYGNATLWLQILNHLKKTFLNKNMLKASLNCKGDKNLQKSLNTHVRKFDFS